MNSRIRLAGLAFLLMIFGTGDLLACGDKFLVGSRGTRYQRPRNARLATVLIYADPSTDAAITAKVQSMLSRRGHQARVVNTMEQLTASIGGGQFAVVVAASDIVAGVEKMFAGAANAAVVVAFDVTANAATILAAVDNAVAQHSRVQRAGRTR
jgi:hypothetical protein